MGDVALIVPVLQAVCSQNNVHCTLLTKAAFAPLFAHIPNLRLVFPDLKGKHKGLFGLYRLYAGLSNTYPFDAVLDLHGVLRSFILTTFFKIGKTSLPIFKINKGRAAKAQAIDEKQPLLKPLKHVTERYADVFKLADFTVDLSKYTPPPLLLSAKVKTFLAPFFNQKQTTPLIGIAPFAAFDTKMYPLEKMKTVISQLSESGNMVFIFGGGAKEKAFAESVQNTQKGIYSTIGQFTLQEELSLMQQMQIMLTMDSSNMHLARLMGTPVVSIWGATHPFLGFSPFQQAEKEGIIQIPVAELPCRPCSVYGNEPCRRGDFACMNRITPERVVEACQVEKL